MHHILRKQARSVHGQSLPPSNLHSQRTISSHNRAATHSRNPPITTYSTFECHTFTLTSQSERGQLCPATCRSKCNQSSVSHPLLQPCIHNMNIFLSHPKVTHRHTNVTCMSMREVHNSMQACTIKHIEIVREKENSQCFHHSKHHTNHSQDSVREISVAPHPADASAVSPASVTPSSNSASTQNPDTVHNRVATITPHPSITTLFTKQGFNNHSLERVREVSWAPNPAEASAVSPESVTLWLRTESQTPRRGHCE